MKLNLSWGHPCSNAFGLYICTNLNNPLDQRSYSFEPNLLSIAQIEPEFLLFREENIYSASMIKWSIDSRSCAILVDQGQGSFLSFWFDLPNVGRLSTSEESGPSFECIRSIEPETKYPNQDQNSKDQKLDPWYLEKLRGLKSDVERIKEISQLKSRIVRVLYLNALKMPPHGEHWGRHKSENDASFRLKGDLISEIRRYTGGKPNPVKKDLRDHLKASSKFRRMRPMKLLFYLDAAGVETVDNLPLNYDLGQELLGLNKNP